MEPRLAQEARARVVQSNIILFLVPTAREPRAQKSKAPESKALERGLGWCARRPRSAPPLGLVLPSATSMPRL